VGRFEEDDEGTGIASDVFKVQGEDPETRGYLRGDRVGTSVISDRGCVSFGSLTMKPRDCTYDSPISV